MKALSVRQPWASLIAARIKTVELRSRPTKHRGPLVICAGVADWSGEAVAEWSRTGLAMPRGVALCAVEVVGCRPATEADRDAAGNPPIPLDGLWAWELAHVRSVAPVPVRGALGLFDVPVTP